MKVKLAKPNDAGRAIHPATARRFMRSTLSSCTVVAVAAFAAGCGDDEEKASRAAAEPAAFAITATAEGNRKALEFPSTVKAGLVKMTLTNSDKVPRSAGIVRLLGDHSVDELIKVIRNIGDGIPIPNWIQDGGGVSTVKPGETASVTQVLAPGRYAITDDETAGADGEGPTNAERGAKGEFTVTGPASDATLPAQPATLTASDTGEGDDKQYSFAFKGLKAGTNQVRFENTGQELHHAIMFAINQGKTIEDVTAVFTSDGPPKGPPPVNFDKTIGTQVIDGGIAQNIELDLPAGRYAVVCFIQDRKGGKPHVANGMIDELTVK
ncbi:MAG TPA: hypothetical protein VGR11_17030 [Solirubrobacteraceae bacterium]|nr:hypothetical protein [Solirubrobacteraceae bacterium]